LTCSTQRLSNSLIPSNLLISYLFSIFCQNHGQSSTAKSFACNNLARSRKKNKVCTHGQPQLFPQRHSQPGTAPGLVPFPCRTGPIPIMLPLRHLDGARFHHRVEESGTHRPMPLTSTLKVPHDSLYNFNEIPCQTPLPTRPTSPARDAGPSSPQHCFFWLWRSWSSIRVAPRFSALWL
jgi:hypothetical protein